MTHTKNKVYRRKEIRYDIDGKTIREIIDFFERVKTAFPDDAWLDIYLEHSFGSDTVGCDIVWEDTETDAEFETRLKQEAKYLEYEKQHYEKLKKKFDKQ